MVTTIRDIMTTNPIVYPASATIAEAAQGMREFDIGDVLVEVDGTVRGIVTDRDIVIRAVADSCAPDAVTVGEICSEVVVTLAPSDSVDRATQLMRDHALRRVPVIEDGTAIGIVTLGDLAIVRDGRSALAAISASPPND
ncbi:MAG TPA: CBS domain-containing protein [Acidimicrobiales bacterium]|nr:CBS domain-containing protein [Acidimicrobiales bacterium]